MKSVPWNMCKFCKTRNITSSSSSFRFFSQTYFSWSLFLPLKKFTLCVFSIPKRARTGWWMMNLIQFNVVKLDRNSSSSLDVVYRQEVRERDRRLECNCIALTTSMRPLSLCLSRRGHGSIHAQGLKARTCACDRPLVASCYWPYIDIDLFLYRLYVHYDRLKEGEHWRGDAWRHVGSAHHATRVYQTHFLPSCVVVMSSFIFLSIF